MWPVIRLRFAPSKLQRPRHASPFGKRAVVNLFAGIGSSLVGVMLPFQERKEMP